MLRGGRGRGSPFLLISLQPKPADSHGCLLGWGQEGGGLHREEEACEGWGGPVWVLETERQEALKHPHAAHRDPVWDAQTRAGPFPPQMPSSQPSDGAPGAPALPARV